MCPSGFEDKTEFVEEAAGDLVLLFAVRGI